MTGFKFKLGWIQANHARPHSLSFPHSWMNQGWWHPSSRCWWGWLGTQLILCYRYYVSTRSTQHIHNSMTDYNLKDLNFSFKKSRFWCVFFFFNFYLLNFGRTGSLLPGGLFSSCSKAGLGGCVLLSSCDARAPHCGGFSCCRARALGCTGFVMLAPGL